MPIELTSRAERRSFRLRIDHSAVLVVVTLSLLFALAIGAALAPHPLVPIEQAAVQGGL